jgi:hypothetical protein
VLVFQCLSVGGENYPLTNYTLLCYTMFVANSVVQGGVMNTQMNTQRYMLPKEFKVWMCATLGLIKDGKMGTSIARADRIKLALAYTRK